MGKISRRIGAAPSLPSSQWGRTGLRESGGTQMDPKMLIERIFGELINQGREDNIEVLIAADYVEHAVGGDIVGRTGFRDYLQSWRAAFPDLYCEVQNVIIQGDLAAWMVRMTGTNSGPLMGMPATGKSVD